jgi:pimeloyl-ACP methyl ester carboxylesterase
MRAHGRSVLLAPDDDRTTLVADRTTMPNGLPHEQIGRDLEAVMAAADFAPAHVIGYSSGGIGCLLLALRRPELFRSLTLIATSYVIDEACAAEVLRMRHGREESWYPEMITELEDLHREGQGPGHSERVLDIWARYAETPPDPQIDLGELQGLAVPTLVIQGDRDRYFPVEIAVEMYRTLPDAELCVLPRCGHAVRMEAVRGIMEAAISRFLAR